MIVNFIKEGKWAKMNRVNELIKEYCPDGVPFQKVKDVYTRVKGTPITAGKMKEIACDDGEIRIFAGGKTIIDAHEKDIPKANITRVPAVLVQSRGVIDVVYYDKPFTFKNEMWAYTSENIVSVKFLYYVLKNSIQTFRDAASGMGSLPQISLKVTEEFKLPVPPLEVQREIVHILDSFTLLTAELTARKKQYEFYRDKLLTFSENKVKYLPLGELYPDIRNGFVGTVTPFFSNKENGVLYLRGTNVHDGVISNEDVVYVSKEFHEKHNRTELKSDDIIMVQSGHVGECAVVGETYAGANCHAVIVMSNGGKCNSKYIVYYFHSYEGRKKLDEITTGGTVKHILASKMKKVIVPIPPLEVQNRLVNVLDNLEAICTDLNIGLPAEIEARQKQYEYYRDLLLTFAETGSTLMTDRQTDRQTDRVKCN